MKLPAPVCRQAGTRQGLPGNALTITRLAFLPAYPAKTGQGGASSQLARDDRKGDENEEPPFS